MEIFKDIEGYEGKYQVSNQGRVKSLNYKRSGKEGLLKPHRVGKPNPNGEYHLAVCLNDRKNHLVHQLMGNAFIPNPENKKLIHHKNGNPEDNRMENLEWATYKENNNDPITIERYKQRKPTEETKEKIRVGVPKRKVLLYNFDTDDKIIFNSIKEAADALGLRQSAICNCCRGLISKTKGYYFRYYNSK